MVKNNCQRKVKLSNNPNGNQFGLPSYTISEEIINAITHGVGVILSIFALIFLVINYPKNFKSMFAISVYSGTLLLLYTISTLYHALKVSKAKSFFRKLDHCSIFLLIAGTYTPLCMIYINGIMSTIILCLVWIVAIVGIVLNAIDVNKFSKLSLGCYIFMGWSIVFIAKPTLQFLSHQQLIWLLTGGIFYTIGSIIYVVGKKVKYMHSVWHLFVLAGSICHFLTLA